MRALGDYIDGAFHAPHGTALISRNPARDGQVVLETAWSAGRTTQACEAAARAASAWAASSRAAR
jgi:RHH-type proline utilization regulon transcriptional repressor/proline dehydrogenase/delta 1-pyrroline-5-carboxylate dehydrogenase